jgi:ATP-dependent RNA helicase DeaD
MTTEPDDSLDQVPAILREALIARGFTALTSVQSAVLDADHRGRDLRISSQTGSGKTIAIGIALFDLLDPEAKETDEKTNDERGVRMPHALVIAPTRELAAQVQKELEWLYEKVGLIVIAVTGGTSFGGELRALRRGADLVVGTPGRLLDHLERGTINARGVRAVVLDEADQMLDFGFREDLESILKKLPEERRTHLVSATFSREIMDLAKRYQHDAMAVQGTRLGQANVDITHVVHVIAPAQRDDVVVNLLLLAPDDATLVFVRTRVDGAELAQELQRLGFAAAALTGDMEQRERTRTLEAFRTGAIKVLVATDVAARGLDIENVPRVIHADPPGDADVYTHRSGRTGRAGKKGTSILLVSPAGREFASRIHRKARVENVVWTKAPTADDVRRVIDARLVEDLTREPAADEIPDPRLFDLADELLAKAEPRTIVARLLRQSRTLSTCAPRDVAAIEPRPAQDHGRTNDRTPRGRMDRPNGRSFDRPRNERSFDRPPNERSFGPPPERPNDRTQAPPERPSLRRDRKPVNLDFVPFRINWGDFSGCDPRRLMALVCRRGNVRGADVGAIQIGATESLFEIKVDQAEQFTQAVRRPDPRDPRIRIEPLLGKTFERGPSDRAADGEFRAPPPERDPDAGPRPPDGGGGGHARITHKRKAHPGGTFEGARAQVDRAMRDQREDRAGRKDRPRPAPPRGKR